MAEPRQRKSIIYFRLQMKFHKSIFLAAIGLVFLGFTQTGIDRQSFFNAFRGESLEVMEKTLERLHQEPVSPKTNAYQGALIMKKASFQKTAKQKIAEFKQGASLLEAAISSSPKNAEFRFLRLCIQENAPKILKYNKNIDSDKELIIQTYPHLNSQLKLIIFNYSKTSVVLSESDLPS